MNGSNSLKAVIDTNVIFMALYNPESKAGRVIQLANGGKLKLFSTDSVKEELIRVMKKELRMDDKTILEVIAGLPISWIRKEIYESKIRDAKVKHKPDKPVEALALTLGCGILSADRHFKKRLDINSVLEGI